MNENAALSAVASELKILRRGEERTRGDLERAIKKFMETANEYASVEDWVCSIPLYNVNASLDRVRAAREEYVEIRAEIALLERIANA